MLCRLAPSILVILLSLSSCSKTTAQSSNPFSDTSGSSEVFLSWCGLCSFRPNFTSAISAIEDVAKKFRASHYFAIGSQRTNRDPSGFPIGGAADRAIDSDESSFLNFPNDKLTAPGLKRFNVFVINHGGNPDRLEPGTPGIYSMVAGKKEYLTDEAVRKFAERIPASVELRSVSEACWGANTSKRMLEARATKDPGCFAALADMNWPAFGVPASTSSWSRTVAEGLASVSLFEATLAAGARTSLGKFTSQNEGDFSNAGLTGSEWIVVDFFRDRYGLSGTSLDLQYKAFARITKDGETSDLTVDAAIYPALAMSIQKRNAFANELQLKLNAISLPVEISTLQDISSAKKPLIQSVNEQMRASSTAFIRDFPDAATAHMMLTNDPESENLREHFGPIALKFKDQIAQFKKEQEYFGQQLVDIENMSGDYANIGQYHRKMYADFLRMRSRLEISFMNQASPELIAKFLSQRTCELRQ